MGQLAVRSTWSLRQRQPGSAIKPVVYATAFEEGLVSPATLMWDLLVKYPTAEPGKEYIPKNYDEKYRGPVTIRTALANSLNVPTVKLFDGIEPSTFITTAAGWALLPSMTPAWIGMDWPQRWAERG